ncbi:Cell division protein FtsW [Streptococcus sp. DD10]|uniref:FtsW/RodA/SpoVE family cell cycle protein n=1 Tax=Streptococcus sp. DD10 TaxID=1777878 RepID=UPI00079145DD|nr:FtsW/RodA/SpoVE family cell cycle protein [Streptococcus sp. DD10]KXT74101.1 Cell division protein FtsW [Streptococcus sp. DD10]
MNNLRRIMDNRVDYSVILPVFLLLIVGMVSIYIAVNHDYPQNFIPIIGQQLAWIILGIFVSLLVMLFSRNFLWRVTPYLYLLGLTLMVLPLFFYSPSLVASTGSKNWVTIGSVTLFQPSEFMKIVYILMLSRCLVLLPDSYFEKNRRGMKDFILIGRAMLHTFPVMILLILQKDFGTSLVFWAIFSGVLFLSGISWRIIVPILVVAGGALTGFLLIFSFENGRGFLHRLGMPTYQINRILAWLNPFDYAQTTAYQQAQGQIAVGSGGLLGQGFNQSNLLIPVRESDMIFTVIAENFGFIGAIFLIFLYLLLLYRIVVVTVLSKDSFYTYISTGIIMMLVFHIFENIGAVTGILPLTGIPLPFISQGGSSIVTNLIAVGLILSMSYQNSLKEERENPQPQKRKKLF